MEDAVAFLPALSVAADRERGLRNGLRPPLAALPQHPHVRVYCGGAFFGIGHGQIGERGPELKLDLYLPPEGSIAKGRRDDVSTKQTASRHESLRDCTGQL